ncbi:LuxR family transcriptional regulator [Sphingomonas sp.]|uniref:LuxR family transcriptional regulator n=1 Tax=Sphingomonas sp. TaxID=28214 RepID=UPI0025E8DE11|nr:LuxR family transcriptional regulator [Sphingomonas sp.]
MPLNRLIEQFSEQAARTDSPAELFALTEAAARELGFSRVALVHGLSFRCPRRGLIHLENFGEWSNVFMERRYYLDDPGLLAAQRITHGFDWSAIRQFLPLSPRQLAILGEAGRHGLRTGYTLPVGVLGEPHGCCSFATERAVLPSRLECLAASHIGAEAFREARRLHGFPGRAMKAPRLSRRKRDCLRYVAMGKTDAEIATILGLSASTVRSYMALLRRDFDVVSRAQLAAAALRLGVIDYDDAIPPF